MKDWLEKYKLALTIATTIVVIFATAWGARAYLDGYATDQELQAVSDESKCGDIVYRIDRILADMFEIESRYEEGQAMTRTDKKRYKKLKKRLKRWEGYEKDLKCEPDK